MPKSARVAFTLIEMAIALTVIGILSAMAIPRLHKSGYDADGGMRTVQIALQQAQRNAIVRQTDVMVSFDTSGNRVRILFDVNNNHIVDAGEEARWLTLEKGVRFATPPAGVQLVGGAPVVGSALASRDGYPTVYYHRDGASSSELEVYLRSYSSELQDFRALHVRQATGRVQTYRYNGSTWMGAGL